MAKILDKTDNSIIVKFSIDEFEGLDENFPIEIKEDISKYEFVFDKPISAKDLLNSFE